MNKSREQALNKKKDSWHPREKHYEVIDSYMNRGGDWRSGNRSEGVKGLMSAYPKSVSYKRANKAVTGWQKQNKKADSQ